MKIGFEETPAAPAGTYSRHLAKLLAEYAPEHEYIVDGARYKELDLYHGFRPGLPLPLLRGIEGLWRAVPAAELAALAVSAAMLLTKDKVFHYRKV